MAHPKRGLVGVVVCSMLISIGWLTSGDTFAGDGGTTHCGELCNDTFTVSVCMCTSDPWQQCAGSREVEICSSEGASSEDTCTSENVTFYAYGNTYEDAEGELGYKCGGVDECGVVNWKGVNAIDTSVCYVNATVCGY